MRAYEINGTYGSGKTEATIFVVPTLFGGAWYAVEDGTNANFTPDGELFVDGIDIEELIDTDCFQTMDKIESLVEFEELVEG